MNKLPEDTYAGACATHIHRGEVIDPQMNVKRTAAIESTGTELSKSKWWRKEMPDVEFLD